MTDGLCLNLCDKICVKAKDIVSRIADPCTRYRMDDSPRKPMRNPTTAGPIMKDKLIMKSMDAPSLAVISRISLIHEKFVGK